MVKELGSRDESDERRGGEEGSSEPQTQLRVSQLTVKNISLTSLLVPQSVSTTHQQERTSSRSSETAGVAE